MQRVSEYVRTWESRCYEVGIPDCVVEKISKSGRAPSYKAIAVAILKNDHNMHSLGFQQRDSVILSEIISAHREKPPQLDLFGGAP